MIPQLWESFRTMGTAPIPKQHVRHDFIVHFPSPHPFIPILPSPGTIAMPFFISFTPHLQRHQNFYRRPGHRKKRPRGSCWLKEKWKNQDREWGSPFGLIRLDVIIKKTFYIWKIVFFKIKSTHADLFFDGCVATVFVGTFDTFIAQLKWNCQMVT